MKVRIGMVKRVSRLMKKDIEKYKETGSRHTARLLQSQSEWQHF